MNTLYLETRGCVDQSINTDIKRHRLCTINNIDCVVNDQVLNVSFSFGHWSRYTYRTTNKRTGAPLKHPVKELVNPDGLSIDTQYDISKTDSRGYIWNMSYRCSAIEKPIHAANYSYTRRDILKVVNKYAVNKFDKLVIIEEAAAGIINKLGGYREKNILNTDSVFIIGQWDDNHKIVKVQSRVNNKLSDFCEVDLVSGRITG